MLNPVQTPSTSASRTRLAPRTRLREPRTRVVLLSGSDPRNCLAHHARRVIDAAYPHLDWITLTPEEVRQDPACMSAHSGLVLAAPAAIALMKAEYDGAWPQLEKKLFATLHFAGNLPGLSRFRTSTPLDIALIRHLECGPCTESAQAARLHMVISLAFEFARLNQRRQLVATASSAAMRSSGSLFECLMKQSAAAYPDIASKCMTMSQCTRQMVHHPDRLCTIVATGATAHALAGLAVNSTLMPHLMPEVHIGSGLAVFTAVASDLDILGDCGFANPTGMIRSAVMLLHHLGASDAATKIEHALHVTLEDGARLTPDIAYRYPGVSNASFTATVIANTGVHSIGLAGRSDYGFRLPRHTGVPARPAANQQ
jgi:hypothetical protein